MGHKAPPLTGGEAHDHTYPQAASLFVQSSKNPRVSRTVTVTWKVAAKVRVQVFAEGPNPPVIVPSHSPDAYFHHQPLPNRTGAMGFTGNPVKVNNVS